MTIGKLHSLMSMSLNDEAVTRYKFVNWMNIDILPSADVEQTIEFRQHHGTLNAEDIEQWIVVNVSLLRAAERQAKLQGPDPSTSTSHETDSSADSVTGICIKHPPGSLKAGDPLTIKADELAWSMREGRKYATRFENEDVMLDKLFELLQLRKTRRTYWRGRLAEYRDPKWRSFPWYESCAECMYDLRGSQILPAMQHNVHTQQKVVETLHHIRDGIERKSSQTCTILLQSSGRPDNDAYRELVRLGRRMAGNGRRIDEAERLLASHKNILANAPAVAERTERLWKTMDETVQMVAL